MTEVLHRPPPAGASSPSLASLRSAPGISIRRLTYHYPDTNAPALADVDLELGDGMTVVAGDSGSGKSSLLRVLNGLIPHFHGGRIRGEAMVRGISVLRARTRQLAREVGFVFQDPEAQFVYGTVQREVAFGPENLGLRRTEIAGRVDEALAAMEIEHLRLRSISTLSGGERQRVALASALAMRPAILAMDETTSQLDPSGADAFLDACLGLAEAGASLVLAEHRLGRLLPVASQLVLMDQGRLQAAGAPRTLAVRLHHPPQVVELARRLGWDPLPLTLAEATLMAPRLARPARRPAAASGPIAWETSGLALAHRGRTVLDGADIAGRAGEVVVLMGDNGSGKTTLLRALAGLHPPASGAVHRHLSDGDRVAYLPQDPTALLHRPSLAAEVDLTLSRTGLTAAAAEAERDLVLDQLGLADLAARYPRDLSGGERQRAAIAAILAGGPALALLDEPTRGMDGSARQALAALVRRMRQAGAAVVLATHDSELAADLGDRIIRLAAGRARDAGPPVEALAAGRSGATQVAQLYPGGPVTVEAALACL